MWHLFLMNKRKGNIYVVSVSLAWIWSHGGCKLGHCSVTLLYCGISGCCSAIPLAVNKLEHLTASVCLPRSSSRPLSALSPEYSTSLVPPQRYLTDGVQQRHKRSLLSFCRCTVPAWKTWRTNITSTQGQRGGMTDTKRQWEKRIRRHVWRGVIRHNETLSEH